MYGLDGLDLDVEDGGTSPDIQAKVSCPTIELGVCEEF